MPKTSKSVLKRQRQTEKRRIANQRMKSAMRTSAKRARAAIEGGSAQEALALVKKAVSLVHRTARKGPVHRNKAARTVSALMKAYQTKFGKLQAAGSAAP